MPIKINFKEIINEIFEAERKKNEFPANFETTLDMDASAWIISDLSLVKIILENLIDNAIKFHNNSKGFTPFAKVKISKVKNEVKVTVEDNGIGMSDRESKDVFRMFMRASERSEIGGIGLYLAKISCEKIAGSIRLAHSDFTGSIFEVIFPIELTEEVKNKNKRVQLLAASRKKIVDASQNSSSAVD